MSRRGAETREPAASSGARPRTSRLAPAVIGLAVLVLLGEAAWFSEPVQEWSTARLPPERLARRVQEEPGSTRARYHYAQALYREGRYRDAFLQVRDVLDQERGGRLYRVAGLCAYHSDHPTDAYPYLQRAYERGDRDAELLEILASLEMRDQLPHAAALLEEAVRRYPQRAEAWYALSRARANLVKTDGWVEASRRATALAPGEARYWVGLAEAQLFRHAVPESLAAADRAVECDRDDPAAWLARARALAQTAPEPPESEVESAFDRATRASNPVRAAEAWRDFGEWRLRRRHVREAVQALERAVQLDPGSDTAAFSLARALQAAGQKARAEQLARRFAARSDAARDRRSAAARDAALGNSPRRYSPAPRVPDTERE